MNKNTQNGIYQNFSLTIAGLGPGDPSLLTLGAVKAIQNSTLIAYPVSVIGGRSLAADIASDWISKDKKTLCLYFPMVKDPIVLKNAWRKAVEQLVSAIKKGEEVVFLSQGDTSLFSTASYVLMEFKRNHPQYHVKVIPGINSFSAAAASIQLPLALQKEQLLVLATPEEPMILQKLLVEANNLNRVIVLMKVGNRWEWVRPLLAKMNLLEQAIFAKRIGFEDQQIESASNVPKGVNPYFSLLLIRQCWPTILS